MTLYRGDFVCQLTATAAEAHDRRIYNVKPDAGLGWAPYTYRVTEHATAVWACHTDEEFREECTRRQVFVISWSPWRDGIRSAHLAMLTND